jgi:DNA-binding transcriptional ArsR family regulator
LSKATTIVLVVDVEKVFGALADPTRRRVVESLGAGPRRAGELAAEVGTSAPTMSRHLRVLLAAGIVTDERPADDARARVFRLRPDSMTALRAWLDQLQALWDEQLQAFKKHVDERNERNAG